MKTLLLIFVLLFILSFVWCIKKLVLKESKIPLADLLLFTSLSFVFFWLLGPLQLFSIIKSLKNFIWKKINTKFVIKK